MMGGSGKGRGKSGKGNNSRNDWHYNHCSEQCSREGWQQTHEHGGWPQGQQGRRASCKGNGARSSGRAQQPPQKGKGKGYSLRNRVGLEAQLLFVKNLPSDIEAEALENVFAKYGKVVKVYVMSGRSPSVRACGFVKYLSGCDAALAVRALHGQFEMQAGCGPMAVQANTPGVFVDNLPRDIEQDVVDYVFSFYGQVQTIHITTRHSRRARAFIEYSSMAEVDTARAALDETTRDLFAGEPLGPQTTADIALQEKPEAIGEPATRLCVVCLAATQSHAFVPCGHRCVCGDCGMTIIGQDLSACPVCRASAEQVLRIFF